MELIIKPFEAPKEISFNYEELDAELEERLKFYTNVVYTDDDIKQAKEDRANLNRFKDTLNQRRIQVEKEWMKPLGDFKNKINLLIAKTDVPAKQIDQRVKEYEKMKQDEKTKEIEEFFAGLEDKPEWLTVAMIWNPKWLNATKSMKSIRDEIVLALEGIKKDLDTLAGITDFGFEATEEYKRTLDINKALSEGMRLAEIQKRKEAEAKAKAEEEAKRAEREAKLDSIINSPTAQIINAAEAKEEAERQQAYMNPPEPAAGAKWVVFEALLTTQQAKDLAAFCKMNGIEIRPYRKEAE